MSGGTIPVGRALPAADGGDTIQRAAGTIVPTPVARSRPHVRPTRSASFRCRPVDKNAARRPPAAHNLRARRYRPTTPAARPSRDGRRAIARSPLSSDPAVESFRAPVTRLPRHPVTTSPGNDDHRGNRVPGCRAACRTSVRRTSPTAITSSHAAAADARRNADGDRNRSRLAAGP